jgi:hypothetical protein
MGKDLTDMNFQKQNDDPLGCVDKIVAGYRAFSLNCCLNREESRSCFNSLALGIKTFLPFGATNHEIQPSGQVDCHAFFWVLTNGR